MDILTSPILLPLLALVLVVCGIAWACETTERALLNEIKHLNSQVRKLRRERRLLTGLLDQHGVPHG